MVIFISKFSVEWLKPSGFPILVNTFLKALLQKESMPAGSGSMLVAQKSLSKSACVLLTALENPHLFQWQLKK